MFTPTTKANLQPLTSLHEAWTSLAQQVLSRLHHSAEADDWAAAVVADIYSKLPGTTGVWRWSGSGPGQDPGSGKVRIIVTSGEQRQVILSTTDADGGMPNLGILGEGTTLVLTDDPSSPPTTAFRQYVVTSSVLDHGGWVSFSALRTATFGIQDTPSADDRVRLLLR